MNSFIFKNKMYISDLIEICIYNYLLVYSNTPIIFELIKHIISNLYIHTNILLIEMILYLLILIY